MGPGIRVVEIGGGISGFQFALARAGADVVNVDPGRDATGLAPPVDHARIARLNRAYRTDVRLIDTVLDDAGLEDEWADTVGTG